jgi:hypothetical protein
MKIFITTLLLVFGITFIAIGVHTSNPIITIFGGLCTGIYNTITNWEEE